MRHSTLEILVETRRKRRSRFFMRLALFVGLPTLFMAIYSFVWATPRYVSEFEVTYQTYQPAQALSAGLVQSFMGVSTGSTIDLGTILYEYVRSPALLAKLDAKLHLREYYSSSKIDWPSRLNPHTSAENFLSYYRWHVAASEGLGGYLTVDVQAFDPQYAFALAKAVDQACDEMIDDMTVRAREDEVKYAQDELNREEDRIRKARLALTDFQNAHGDLNPQTAATQLGQIAGGLESDLAKARSELAIVLQYMRADSPKVLQIKYQIKALEQQLRYERERLASSGGKTAYSQILNEYSALQLEQQFAQDAYLAAQQGLAVARADAARKQNYLIDFTPPYLPDKATIWLPLEYTATAFFASLLIYGISSLMIGAFRDQAGL